MSSIAAWNRPSSLLLTAVVAANLILPVMHFRPGTADAAETAASRAPASATASVVPASGPSVSQIEPIYPPVPARRVALRKSAPVCRAWGPFGELGEAETLAASLELDRRSFEVFQSEVEAPPDYLVTVRASGSRNAADRVLEELASRSIDSYPLERDGDGSVLSVGVFSSPARAGAQRERMAELGYQAAVTALDRTHRVYHLMARMPADLEPKVPADGACADIAPLQQFL